MVGRIASRTKYRNSSGGVSVFQQRRTWLRLPMCPDRTAEKAERTAILHLAGASNGQQTRYGNFTLRAAATEADLPPLHSAAERALDRVVGRFHSFLVEEREEPF